MTCEPGEGGMGQPSAADVARPLLETGNRERGGPGFTKVSFPIRGVRILMCGGDIGFLKIRAFEEEGFARAFGERISEKVAEIQPGPVAPLAEIEESLPRQVRLLNGYRFKHNAGPAEKSIALTTGVGANLTFNNHAQLDEVRRTHQAAVGAMNKLGVEGGVSFPEKNSGQS